MDILCIGRACRSGGPEEPAAAPPVSSPPALTLLGHALSILKLWRLDYAFVPAGAQVGGTAGPAGQDCLASLREDDSGEPGDSGDPGDSGEPGVILFDETDPEAAADWIRKYPQALTVFLPGDAREDGFGTGGPEGSGGLGGSGEGETARLLTLLAGCPETPDYLLAARESFRGPEDPDQVQKSLNELAAAREIPFILDLRGTGEICYREFGSAGKVLVPRIAAGGTGTSASGETAGPVFPAGEVFPGAFAYSLYWGMDFREAVEFGALAVGLAAGFARRRRKNGGNPPGAGGDSGAAYPDLDEMLAAYEKGPV